MTADRLGTIDLAVRDLSELDPADADHPDTLCIKHSDLLRILVRHFGVLTPAAGRKADPFGDMPAPITNPEAWPPNYADGWNDAVLHMVDAFPLVRANFAAARTPETVRELSVRDFGAKGDGVTDDTAAFQAAADASAAALSAAPARAFVDVPDKAWSLEFRDITGAEIGQPIDARPLRGTRLSAAPSRESTRYRDFMADLSAAPAGEDYEARFRAWMAANGIGREPAAAPTPEGDDIAASFERWARLNYPSLRGESYDRIEGRPGNVLGMTWEYNGDALQSAWFVWSAAWFAASHQEGRRG